MEHALLPPQTEALCFHDPTQYITSLFTLKPQEGGELHYNQRVLCQLQHNKHDAIIIYVVTELGG